MEKIHKLLMGHHNNSVVLKYNTEAARIRNEFIDNLRIDFNHIWKLEDEGISEEMQLVDSIEKLINCEDFSSILGCNEYLIKIKNIFDNCKLSVGKSKMQLTKIDASLHEMKKSYENEFANFCQSANESIEKDIRDIDLETKKEIEEFFKEKMISKSLFNELKNASLLRRNLI